MKGKRVYVHCQMGVSRSASIVIAFLMKRFRCSVREAFSHVKKVREVIDPNPSFVKQLLLFEKLNYSTLPDGSNEYYLDKFFTNQKLRVDVLLDDKEFSEIKADFMSS